jgi:hypothetical protein
MTTAPSDAFQPNGYGLRNRAELIFALFTVAAGLVIGIRYYVGLWVFDSNDFSEMSDRLPYWDFTNLWAGTRIAIQGNVNWLFDVEAYRQALRAMFSPILPDQEWSYPPSMLLLGLPLNYLPIFWAYVVWTLGTIVAFYLSLRALRLPVLVHLAVVLSPAAAISAIFGQNGALTASLLIAALALSDKKPVLAGIFAGLLTIKPHLGILIPFVYLASGNWRAIVSATLMAGGLIVFTGLRFGFETWPLFLEKTAPLMASILEAPYPQLYHANALTFFIFGRSLGMSVGGAYLFQAAFTLMSIAVVIWLWRKASGIDFTNRVVLTALLSICATPYGYSYDTAPFSLAVAWFFMHARAPRAYIFGALWLCPYVAHLPNYWGYSVGVLVPTGLAVYGFWTILRSRRRKYEPTAAASTLFQSGDSRPSAG